MDCTHLIGSQTLRPSHINSANTVKVTLAHSRQVEQSGRRKVREVCRLS